jgi:polysaccharide biosynthesis/export protein
MTRFLLILGLALAACGVKTPYYDYAKEPNPRDLEYTIGVPDGLQITVWKNPELSTEATVRPDGTITMPLLGDIKAAGRTPSELKAEIGQRLQSFVKDEGAVVTIAVTSVASYKFTVSGNVNTPGVFGAQNYVNVAEAMALAGGPNRFAEPAGLVLIRKDKSGKFKRIPINYDDVRSNKRPDMNLVLLAGDTLFMP